LSVAAEPGVKTMNKREFIASALAWSGLGTLYAANPVGAPQPGDIDATLSRGIAGRKIPAVTATVARSGRILHRCAFGTRDAQSGVSVATDSIFAIASMTKAITSAAALQLVEREKLSLTEPASRHLPELASIRVLEGFDGSGKPKLRAPKTPITLRHLLTHTSGFCYDTWSEEMLKWEASGGQTVSLSSVAPHVPLMFDPGARWQYGYSVDWVGKLVEAASGLTLEEYFQRNIMHPLSMADTTFVFPEGKFDRLVTGYVRQEDGSLKPDPRALPPNPVAFNGGGGLYSTTDDYVKFMQMILRRGTGADGRQILRPETVALMTRNQIGQLTAGRLKSQRPGVSRDVDLHPGASDRWGLGFLINEVAYPGGRSAGSLAWAGIFNTFYWIDPTRDLCAVIMMQYLPFVDPQAVALLGDFERAVYATFARAT
jgi:methyl acetate hydrolase